MVNPDVVEEHEPNIKRSDQQIRHIVENEESSLVNT